MSFVVPSSIRSFVMLALLLAVALVLFVAANTVHAQDPLKVAAPVVNLSSCDEGCITVGFGPFTDEDWSAYSLDSQMFSTSSALTITDEHGPHTRQGTLHTRLETHWKYTDDPNSSWQEWVRQESPGDTLSLIHI